MTGLKKMTTQRTMTQGNNEILPVPSDPSVAERILAVVGLD